MPVMKKTILYSLFIVSSLNFSLHAQDKHLQDNDDLLFIFDDSSEEIHPLEDVDTVVLAPEIQSYIHGLELDPAIKMELVVEGDDPFLEEIVEKQDIPTAMQGFQVTDNHTIDPVVVPAAPEDIVILDQAAVNEEQSCGIIVCNIDENHTISCQTASPENIENVTSFVPTEQYEVPTIDQAQLEELLNMQCRQQMEEYASYVADATAVSSPQEGDCPTISIDNVQTFTVLNNGILLVGDDELSLSEDDDIVPVPHDLINSVKKANKKKKKLEKAQCKKSKKNNKKSAKK